MMEKKEYTQVVSTALVFISNLFYFQSIECVHCIECDNTNVLRLVSIDLVKFIPISPKLKINNPEIIAV